jgi:DNA repair protein RecN (Recombination protein N)
VDVVDGHIYVESTGGYYFLRGYGATIDASPTRLQEVEDRLALLERLKRKHGPTLADVIARREGLRAERATLDSLDDRLKDAEAALESSEHRYLEASRALSVKRHKAATRLASALVGQLADLAMGQTRFEFRFQEDGASPDRWTERGLDEGEFFVSPNPGEELRPLARIVSGGELSRVMLGIKSLASLDRPGKTLVFDEVDAGIGGRVADAVGEKLRALGRDFQVLCITHLPQIAAYGTWHYAIEKRVEGGRTSTRVTRLLGQDREDELARMLGGAQVSDLARRNAREMLALRQGESKANAKAKGKK